MSFKKIVTIAAAAGALAAISLPAMAFENEFHGSSAMRYFLSNYEAGGGGNPLAITGGFVPLQAYNATNNLKMNNYIEQRTRISYIAKASDDLRLVTAFELDSVFGDRSQSGTTPGAQIGNPAGAGGTFSGQQLSNITGATGRNQGGAWESDTVSLETKNIYLDFKIPSTPVNVKTGIMPIRDGLKDIFFLADAAGVLTSTKLGAATVNAGYFRGYDQSYFGVNSAGTAAAQSRARGMDNMELGILEGKFALSKDLNLGALYYLYNDGRAINGGTVGANNTGTIQIHTFGLTGDAKVGPLSLSGFLAYQGGDFRNTAGNAAGDSAYLNAFAYNLAAKLAAGPGTLKTALLFTSGNSATDGNAVRKHYTGWVGTSQCQNQAWSNAAGTSYYSEADTWLLTRTTASSGTTDMAIAYNTGNGSTPFNGQGLYLASLGYDANLTPKLFLNANYGALWAAKTNALKPTDFGTGKQNGTNYMASEINLEAGYKMYDNLTATLGGAYVLLGGYYKGASAYSSTANGAKDPENPYSIRTTLKYAF
jgi:hypothetical protein